VIVRIATEGQFRIPDGDVDRLNELDNAVVAAVDAGDEEGFHERFEQLLEFVRSEGVAVGDDELEGSAIIIPPPDLTFAEAGETWSGEGLIPD
jgi:PspAA-like protein